MNNLLWSGIVLGNGNMSMSNQILLYWTLCTSGKKLISTTTTTIYAHNMKIDRPREANIGSNVCLMNNDRKYYNAGQLLLSIQIRMNQPLSCFLPHLFLFYIIIRKYQSELEYGRISTFLHNIFPERQNMFPPSNYVTSQTNSKIVLEKNIKIKWSSHCSSVS